MLLLGSLAPKSRRTCISLARAVREYNKKDGGGKKGGGNGKKGGGGGGKKKGSKA